METLGEYTGNLSFPVCNKFQPTVQDGQLCYELDIASVLRQDTRPGLVNGILLVIDPGVDIKESTRKTS